MKGLQPLRRISCSAGAGPPASFSCSLAFSFLFLSANPPRPLRLCVIFSVLLLAPGSARGIFLLSLRKTLPAGRGQSESRKMMYDDAHRLVGIVPRALLVSTILKTSL